jgi:hypothetical protein
VEEFESYLVTGFVMERMTVVIKEQKMKQTAQQSAADCQRNAKHTAPMDVVSVQQLYAMALRTVLMAATRLHATVMQVI